MEGAPVLHDSRASSRGPRLQVVFQARCCDGTKHNNRLQQNRLHHVDAANAIVKNDRSAKKVLQKKGSGWSENCFGESFGTPWDERFGSHKRARTILGFVVGRIAICRDSCWSLTPPNLHDQPPPPLPTLSLVAGRRMAFRNVVMQCSCLAKLTKSCSQPRPQKHFSSTMKLTHKALCIHPDFFDKSTPLTWILLVSHSTDLIKTRSGQTHIAS